MTTQDALPGGSERATAPRWLAREDRRQWIVGVIAISVLVPAIYFGLRDVDEATSASDAFRRTAVPLVIAYGMMQLINVVIYVPLTLFAFRGLEGDDLAAVARFSSPRNAEEERRLRRYGVDEVSTAVGAGFISLACVVVFVLVPSVREEPLVTYGALAAMVGSWIMIVMAFAVRYMRDWATLALESDALDDWTEPPVFLDFVLLSVQVSTGYNLAPRLLVRRAGRRNALTHNVLAYVFNTVIIALVISVALPAVLS
jgi:uncharacterized membrane protein